MSLNNGYFDSLNSYLTPDTMGFNKVATASPSPTDIGINKTSTGAFDSLNLFGGASQGLSALGSLLQAYNGYKQLQLGKDAFNFQKSSYNQDTANQAKLVNSQLEDRQQSRLTSTGNNNASGAYDSLTSYMDKNRVTAKQL